MKAYQAYKESGYDWVGKIPVHWNMVQLKFAAPRKSDQTENVKEFGFQIALENIESKTGKLISKGSFEGLGNVFRKGDVLFNKLRPYLCKVVIVPEAGVAVGELLVLRPRADIDKRFLFYRLLENKFISVVDGSTYGAKMPRASWDFIGNLKTPIPQLHEQQAIADFLDRKTSQIDTLIAKKQRQIELLQEQRTALINQVVTKGLNLDAPMKDSGVDWLGEIPSHWNMRKTKYLFFLSTEKAPNDNDMELLSLYTEIGVRPRKDLEARGNKASTTNGYWIVKEGDIIVNKLLAWMGAVGYSAYEGVTSPAYDILRKTAPLNSKFYHYLFRCGIYLPEFKRRSRGIMEMRLRLYFDELGQIPLVYPPLEEQNQIVGYLDALEEDVNQTTSKITKQIELLQEYRTALISEAVTGKIDVRTTG